MAHNPDANLDGLHIRRARVARDSMARTELEGDSMTGEEIGLVGLLVGCVMGMIRILEGVVHSVLKKGSVLTTSESEKLTNVDAVLSHKNEGGAPAVYFPPSVARAMDKQTEVLQEISAHTKGLDRMVEDVRRMRAHQARLTQDRPGH